METIYIGNTGRTALGMIWAAVSTDGLIAVEFPSSQRGFSTALKKRYHIPIEFNPEKIADFLDQLSEYAQGTRQVFTFPLDWSVLNKFQQKALKATMAIPYGQTRTYKEIAAGTGNPRAARAVGRAEATNPMPLVIPCHRVVGTDGKLHGYGAGNGLKTKAWLLKLEGVVLA
jgi:methylated-DNA-[protein]-cysteine S-methyltransferase